MAKRKQPILKTLLLLILILSIAAAGALYFFFYFPYQQARTDMPPSAAFELRENADGTIHLSWPEARGADFYLLEIFPAASGETTGLLSSEPEALYSAVMPGQTECDLPALPAEGDVTIRVRSAAWYRTPREEKLRMGETALELTTALYAPTVAIHSITPVPQQKIVTINFEADHSTSSRLYLVEADGSFRQLNQTDGNAFTVSFGENADLPFPNRGTTYTFRIDGYREETSLAFHGYPTVEFTIERNALLGTELAPVAQQQGANRYNLTWEETRGSGYIVQMRDDDQSDWVELGTTGESICSFTTDALPAFCTRQLRVLSVNDDPEDAEPYACISEPITIETGATAVYTTIWPLKDLPVYDQPDGKVIGTAEAASAYCVIDETGLWFQVLHEGTIGYIESAYCMINLPEYLGDLCSYDIVNSYSALYMVHEYGIPDVTATVIKGYENIRMNRGSYLVPLLYPTAQKLVTAAKYAADAGCKLRIYDAYRPREATVDIYNVAYKLMDQPIPDAPFAGIPPADLPEVPEGSVLTYRQLMTDGRYGLGQFLAAGYSMHNLGVALDLTLEDLETAQQLQMQTSMHDLSHYSVVSNNNDNANLLASIMVEAGFGTLESEWWHFQDDMLTNALALDCHLYGGVSAACWVTDGKHWRYRTANGQFFAGTTKVIDGTTFHFDSEGCVTDAPWILNVE